MDMTSTPAAPITIEQWPILPLTLSMDAWDMYRNRFDDINRNAVQRHMMTELEFIEAGQDRRIRKYVARSPGGDVEGLSLLTNDLDAWPLISPAYFEHHHPKLYAEQRIFYVGFVTVTQAGRSANLFQRLIAEMYQPVIAVDGIAVMDFCAVNVDDLHLPRATTMILQRLNPMAGGHMLDRQEFWAWDFTGKP